ncbi:MAG TPA: heavy metal-binding domain-containing protein [Chitinophagaceae bacterium]|nr:heavy metal-binding domain-containing protein [Chitinophagaceae bacterium]
MKKVIILAIGLFITSINVFAQEKANKKDTTAHVTLNSYACPKHPNFISDKPGKCPKCDMDLAQLSAKEQLKRDVTKAYTCPVHADVISTQPGKCPKCGTNLSLKEQFKAEVAKLYTCPMHPDVTNDRPGKCPKCGMDLVEKKTKIKNQ